jgi:hypothetical protein
LRWKVRGFYGMLVLKPVNTVLQQWKRTSTWDKKLKRKGKRKKKKKTLT